MARATSSSPKSLPSSSGRFAISLPLEGGRETMLFVLILFSLLLSSVAAETFISTARNALDKFIHRDNHWETENGGLSTTNGSYLVFYRGLHLSYYPCDTYSSQGTP